MAARSDRACGQSAACLRPATEAVAPAPVDDAVMIVVGIDGSDCSRRALEFAASGSVSQQCAQHTHCPVVIVPAEEQS